MEDRIGKLSPEKCDNEREALEPLAHYRIFRVKVFQFDPPSLLYPFVEIRESKIIFRKRGWILSPPSETELKK